MTKHQPTNPAKLRPWWRRTARDVQAANTGCKHCHGTGVCPDCDGDGCMLCNYTGVCRHCKELPVKLER